MKEKRKTFVFVTVFIIVAVVAVVDVAAVFASHCARSVLISITRSRILPRDGHKMWPWTEKPDKAEREYRKMKCKAYVGARRSRKYSTVEL